MQAKFLTVKVKRYFVVGWGVILGSLAVTLLVLSSRPHAEAAFLDDTRLATIAYDTDHGYGRLILSYYPRRRMAEFRPIVERELRPQGYSVAKAKRAVVFKSPHQTVTLAPRDASKNPRLQVTFERPASIKEILFHPFWVTKSLR